MREFACTWPAPLTFDPTVKKEPLYEAWTPACLRGMHSNVTESQHTYTCSVHMAACMSSCLARPLPLYSLLCACFPSLLRWSGTLSCYPLFSSPLSLWMLSSVTTDNEGWILWPTTPTWQSHKSLTVTSDNRRRENQWQRSSWCIYVYSPVRLLLDSLMV